MNSHDAALLDIARFALRRHRTPEKALPGFADKIWNNAAFLRALVGADVIKAAALEYLKSVPSKEGGGVRLIRESPESLGSADSSGGDEVQVRSESQEKGGLSSPDPNIIPVVAHNRHKPGNAKRGLAEVTAMAARSPAIFVTLSDGKTNAELLTYGFYKRLVTDSAYDGALAFMVLRHAQPASDATKACDVVGHDRFVEFKRIAGEFARLVKSGVSITIEAYIAATEAPQLEPQNAA